MNEAMKAFRDLRYQVFYRLLMRRAELLTLGAPDSICKWTICPTGLGKQSIVYSAGLGSDITFEHALAAKFGCELLLCDPSPTGINTMALPENRIPQFHFFPLALAGRSGELSLAPPLEPAGDSWFASAQAPGSLKVSSADLGSLMRQNKHDHIDLLKMDIEGSEYEVINDILKNELPIGQICVEFHHGILPGIRRRQTITAMLRLIARGYKLVDQTGFNHTFVRTLDKAARLQTPSSFS